MFLGSPLCDHLVKQSTSELDRRATEQEIKNNIIAPKDLRPVHTTPEEFKNEGFTLKTHKMFSLHTTLEDDLKTEAIIGSTPPSPSQGYNIIKTNKTTNKPTESFIS